MASTFRLQRHGGALRIAAYVNHEGLGARPGTAPSVPAPHGAAIEVVELDAADQPPAATP